MGARASIERQQDSLFAQIAALDVNSSFNRNQRTLFERLLLFFNKTGVNELRLNRDCSIDMFLAIARFKKLGDPTIQAESWFQRFDVDNDNTLNWDEFCEAIKILLQAERFNNTEKQTLIAKENDDEFASMKDLSSINADL